MFYVSRGRFTCKGGSAMLDLRSEGTALRPKWHDQSTGPPCGSGIDISGPAKRIKYRICIMSPSPCRHGSRTVARGRWPPSKIQIWPFREGLKSFFRLENPFVGSFFSEKFSKKNQGVRVPGSPLRVRLPAVTSMSIISWDWTHPAFVEMRLARKSNSRKAQPLLHWLLRAHRIFYFYALVCLCFLHITPFHIILQFAKNLGWSWKNWRFVSSENKKGIIGKKYICVALKITFQLLVPWDSRTMWKNCPTSGAKCEVNSWCNLRRKQMSSSLCFFFSPRNLVLFAKTLRCSV